MRARRALAIMAVNLRLLVADRTVLFFILVLPMVMLYFIGLAFGGEGEEARVAVRQASGGPLAAELNAEIRRFRPFEAVDADDEEELRKDVRAGWIDAGVIIPPRYDDDLREGRPVHVVLVADIKQGQTTAIRSALSSMVARQAARVGAAQAAVERAGLTFDAALEQARRTSRAGGTVRLEPTVVGNAPTREGFSTEAPGNLLIFVFVNSVGAAGGLVLTRRLGVATRMVSTPTSVGTVVAGEIGARLFISLLQAAIIVGLGFAVFGVRWGDPLATATVTVLFAVVSAGAAVLLGSAMRNEEQAVAVGIPLAIALAMLGGCMWPLEIVGPTMRAVGHVVPHAWAMDAFDALEIPGSTLGDIALEVVVLFDYGLALILLAAWRLRRSITSPGGTVASTLLGQ